MFFSHNNEKNLTLLLAQGKDDKNNQTFKCVIPWTTSVLHYLFVFEFANCTERVFKPFDLMKKMKMYLHFM